MSRRVKKGEPKDSYYLRPKLSLVPPRNYSQTVTLSINVDIDNGVNNKGRKLLIHKDRGKTVTPMTLRTLVSPLNGFRRF